MYNDPSHRQLLSTAPNAPFISTTNGDREIDSHGIDDRDRVCSRTT
jgi:hypothetical protein